VAADWFEMPAASQPAGGSDAGASRTDAVKAKLKASATAAATPAHDAETGEVAEPSPADAYQLGRDARDKGKALKAVPPEFREPAMQAFADAWAEGWRSRDEELAAEKAK